MLNCSGLIFSGLLVRFRKNSDHQYKPSASNKTEPISRSNTHFQRHSFPSSPIKSAAVRDVLFHKCLYQTLCFLILTDDPETIKDSLWLPLAASEQSHPHLPPSYRPCSIKMPGRNLTLLPQTLCTRCWLRSRAALPSPPLPSASAAASEPALTALPGPSPPPPPAMPCALFTGVILDYLCLFICSSSIFPVGLSLTKAGPTSTSTPKENCRPRGIKASVRSPTVSIICKARDAVV